jgi:5-hydroxyisourate hydrolase-like protein (transthyretin family)
VKNKSIPRVCCVALLAVLLFSLSALGAEAAKFVTVKDAEGNPVPGARVVLCAARARMETTILAEGETDADGKWMIPATEEKAFVYKLLFAFKPGLSWGGTAGMRTNAEDLSITLNAPAKISGKVTDKKGDPIEGATIRPAHVSDPKDPQRSSFGVVPGLPFLTARTNAQGEFTLEDLPAGATVMLWTEAPPGFANAMDYQIRYEPPVENLAIQLGPESRIKGTLKHEKTGKPAAGVTVTANRPRGGGYGYAVTDENGAFELLNLNAGDYQINLDTRTEDWGGVPVGPATVSVAEGQALENVAILWTEGAMVEGRILDARTNAPIPGASTYLQPSPPSPGSQGFAGPVDAEGRFHFRAPPGSYSFAAYAQDYDRFSSNSTVTEGENRFGDILLTKMPESVVRIEDAEGAPLSGATVTRWSQVIATSDEQGVVRLRPQPGYRGEENLIVVTPDGALAGMFDMPGDSDADVKWTLKKAGGISGIVRKEDGEPIGGAQVQPFWIRQMGQGTTGGPLPGKTVWTGPDGKYVLSGLPAGMEYGVQAEAVGYGKSDPWNEKRYLVGAGETVEAEPVTLMKAEAELTGRVVDPTGAGVAGVAIQMNGQRVGNSETTTDADGRFTFKGLPLSEVNLSIRTDPMNPIWREVTPEQFGDVTITIYPQFDFNAVLPAGAQPPELEGIEWVSGEWPGFDAARGSSVAVAFVAIENPNSRKAIRVLNSAVQSSGGKLKAVLVHDASATADEIKSYLTENAVTLPVARVEMEAEAGWYSPAFAGWKASTIPTVILIGADGRVTQGRVPLDELEAVLAAAMK